MKNSRSVFNNRERMLKTKTRDDERKWCQEVIPNEFHIQSPIPNPDICRAIFLEGIQFPRTTWTEDLKSMFCS